MSNPLVSIIIPTYNRAYLIGETLDSIIAQTYTNWECILVDDGSTDNTLQTLNQYAKKDNRLKVFSRPKSLPKGANACRNYGFKNAKGTYINWFDSDDIMHEDFLLKKITAFKDYTDGVLHKNRYANYNLTRFRESKFKYTNSESLFYNYAMDEIEIQTSGFMWKKKYLKERTLFNESIQRFQDNEFHIRMLALKPEIIILDSILATIRGGNGDRTQISFTKNLTKKKLYDIFYYRYQTLKLNQTVQGLQYKLINREVSKKALWTFYDTLRFEKNIFNRFKDIRDNYIKLKIVYLSKSINLYSKIKSHIYLIYLVLFGNVFYNKKR